MGRLIIKKDKDSRLVQQNELPYDEQNGYSTFREQHTTERERKILLAVLEEGLAGISLAHLVLKLKIDRKIISRYLKKLVQEKLVKRGKGGHGKFFPTRQGLEDPSSSATLLGLLFARGPLQDRTILLQSDVLKKSGCIDFTAVPQFTTGNKDSYGLVRSLFEFSSTIGAFIIFVLIQSINARSIRKYRSRMTQSEVSQIWIKNAISQVIPYLFPVFIKYVEPALSNHFGLQSEQEMSDFLVEWHLPSSGYNDKVIRRLLRSLGQLYPRVWFGLDKIKRDIPEEIESMVFHAEYTRMKNEYQRNCSHEFVEVKEPHPSNWFLKHCKKCHYTDPRSRVHRRVK